MELKAVPTGLTLCTRPFTLGDIRKLAQIPERRRKYEGELACVMDMCLEPPYVIGDPPYGGFKEGDVPDLKRILPWDLFSIAIQNRGVASPEIRLQPNCIHCGAKVADNTPIVLDVRDISHFPASERGIEVLKGWDGKGAPPAVDAEIQPGLTVWLSPPLDVKLDDIGKDATVLAAINLIYRKSIVKVVRDGKDVPPEEFWDGISDFELLERIKEASDDLWGGVDMFFTWTCQNSECRKEQQQMIPFGMLVLPQADLFSGATLARRKAGIKPLKKAG